MAQHQDKPADITTEPGKVIEHKPDGSAIAMSPRDAVVTAQRLLEGAAEAEGARLVEHGKKRTRRS